MPAKLASVVFTAVALTVLVHGEEFLAGSGGSRLAQKANLDAEFQQAMSAVMGCGVDAVDVGNREHDVVTIQKALAPMWRVLPKNAYARVEWRLLRYMTHRYFMQRYSLLIRGFEPTQEVNVSGLGASSILGRQAPSLVETMLQGKHNANGFTLEDAAVMVATLERLIFDSETTLLRHVYQKQRLSLSVSLDHEELVQVIQMYLLHWLIADDEEGVDLLMSNASFRLEVIPQWEDIRGFAHGMVKAMEFERQRSARPGHGRVAMTQRYTFDDAHQALGGMTKTFGSFWGNECRTVKAALIRLDKRGVGRVPLSHFYGANMDGNWHFGESEAYLRELGALDESSTSHGKQVIIPNYIQGASNCVVGTAHYLVCCPNECEEYLNHIEDLIGSSVAVPSAILDVVTNITLEDDELPRVDASLTSQLLRIANIHGGIVPLHGRLFGQWLHYVFPRDCPFPHKAGSVNTIHVNEFGEESHATLEEVRNHAAARKDPSKDLVGIVDEAHWMTQWSEDEELHADYREQLRAPWESQFPRSFVKGTVAAVGFVLVVAGVISARDKDAARQTFQDRATYCL